MLGSFQKVFNPTPLQKELQEKLIRELEIMAYEKKFCCTCKNFIPVEDLPATFEVLPECKLGGLALDTCKDYICNKN